MSDTDTKPSLRQRRVDRKDAQRRERQAKIRAKSGNRYRVHYDIDGPRVRLGILWFGVVLVALALGHWAVGLVYGVTAAAASAHAARTWRARGKRADNVVAFGCTALVVAAAIFHPRLMGGALMLVVVITLLVAATDRRGDLRAAIVDAGVLVQVCVPAAVGAGCLTLLADLHLGAAVTLVVAVSAYESGDYLVGSGAPNVVEGPIAGIAAALVTSLVLYIPGVPPFESGFQAIAFAIVAGVGAVAGQYVASVVLPHSRAYAPALRRLDSILVSAPLWYAGVDLLVL